MAEERNSEEKEKIFEKSIEKTYLEALYKDKKEGKEVLSEKEKIIKEEMEQELKREVLKLSRNPQLKDDAQKTAQKIKDLNLDGKLERLFKIAQTKGIKIAVYVAQQTNDHYLIDTFHDLLAKDETYKKFSP